MCVLIQLLGSRGYAVEVRVFPLNDLSLVPTADRPFLFFFRDELLTVCAPAVAPVVLAQISKLEVSLCDDSSAVDPDFLELG